MKKKTLLCTTIAGTMFIAGLAMSSVNAASNETKAKLGTNIPEPGRNGIVIELMNDNVKLTEEDVKTIVADKYKNTNVKVETISPVKDGIVGTGAVVTLNTGKQLTVVLYGDTTGDGEIDVKDAQALIDYQYKKTTLTSAQLMAANVLGKDQVIDTRDAQRIFEYQWAANHEGYAKEEYADLFVGMNESSPSTIKLTATVSDKTTEADYTGSGNTSKIGEVVVDKNTNEIKLRIKNLDTDLTKVFTNNVNVSSIDTSLTDTKYTTGKWYRIKFDTGLSEEHYKVEGAVLSKGYLWLNADQGAEIPVTITNLDDPTEVMKVTVKLVDATEVELWTARKVTNPTGNTTEVQTVVPDGDFQKLQSTNKNTVTIEAYVGAMANEKVNDVDGRWFAIELVADMPASRLNAVAYDWGTTDNTPAPEKFSYEYKLEGSDTPLASSDPYYTANTGDRYNADSPRYAVTLYVNALSKTQKILVYNKEALTSDLTYKTSSETNTTKRALTVKVENNGSLDPTVYVAGDTSSNYTGVDTTDKPLETNQKAITVTNETSQNVIEVSAKLNEMKKFNIENNKVKAKADGNGEDETGKKYFAVILNLGEIGVDETAISGIEYTKLTAEMTKFANSDNSDADNTHTILIWLDAEAQYPKTFTIKGGTKSGSAQKDSDMTMTINLTDVSTPLPSPAAKTLVSVANSENSKAVSIDSAQTTDAKTITVNARKNGMTKSTRVNPLTGKEEEGKWFALRIKTSVPSKLLGLDVTTGRSTEGFKDNLLPASELNAGYTDLADDEIVLWVNALNNSTTYTIKNINKISETAAITVTVADTSTLSLGNLVAVSATTVGGPNVKTTLGLTEEAQATLVANANTTTVQTPTQPAYKINVNVNNLKEVELPKLGKGKWVVYNLTLGTTTVRDTIVEENGIDKSHADAFALTGKSVLLWVDVAKLTDKEKTTFEVKSTDANGVTEVVEYTIELNDTSTFKNTESVPKAETGYTLTDEFIQSHRPENHFSSMTDDTTAANQYLVNQALVTDVDAERDGNVVNVTVTGDFNKMYSLRNNPGFVGKIVTLKLDLGIEVKDGELQYAQSSTTDKEGKLWINAQQNGTTDDLQQAKWFDYSTTGDKEHYGVENGEAVVFNFSVPDNAGSTDTVWTTSLVFRNKQAGANGDTLTFVVKFVQSSVDDSVFGEYKTKYGVNS